MSRTVVEMRKAAARPDEVAQKYPGLESAKRALESARKVRSPRKVLRLSRPLTDAGNAERLADQHCETLRYVPEWGSWIHFDGKRWKRDDDGAAMRAAIETVRGIYHEAGRRSETSSRSDLAAHALRSESAARIRAMLELATSSERLILHASELDPLPATMYLLNVENGCLDVRTGQLQEHDACRLITRLAPVTFDPSATCREWETFLARILPNAELRGFLQRYAGAALTSDTGDQCFALLHGSGANGKSTLVAVLLRLLGDYAHQADFESFLQASFRTDRRGGARSDLVSLQGVRLVAAIETGDGRRLNEALIKSLTGGDAITARGLYERTQTTFTPELHLMLSANELPRIHGDPAIWRRVHAVEFPVTIPESERDARLLSRLTAPEALSGVLNWCLAGAREWYQEGSTTRLRPPAAVREATSAYREGEDSLAAFFEDCCRLDSVAWTPTKELRAVYHRWAESAAETPVGDRALANKLRSMGLQPSRRPERGWCGIRLVMTP